MEREAIIIGAGISGLAAAKCMLEAGFKVTVLERTGDVGGLWHFREKNYGVMRFTHINVSKANYCFSDFPVSDDLPDYLHNAELDKYIQEYTKHFGLYKHIQFRRQVNRVSRTGKRWVLEVEEVEEDKDGVITPTGKLQTLECDHLGIATGHHTKPTYPSFPGLDTFTGKAYHSVDFKDAATNGLAAKKVVIVGIGNSAVDIACHAAATGSAKPVHISTRSGAWVVSNYLFGRPIDHYACRLYLWLPWRVGTFVIEKIVSLVYGHPNNWRLNPKMHALQTQPTVSPTLLHHIQRGEVVIKPNIKCIEGSRVIYEDGTSVEPDHLIQCTGYAIDLPFLPEDVKQHFFKDGNTIKLYKNVFAPTIGQSLAFIGFVQPASGGLLTMSETQARWWAELCRKQVTLPSVAEMEEDILWDEEYVKTRWFHSKRHTIQRDPVIYNDEIADMIGAKPSIKQNPTLAWKLLLGAGGAAQWRLQGPGAWTGAKTAVNKVKVTDFLHYSALAVIGLVLLMFWWMCSYIRGVLFG